MQGAWFTSTNQFRCDEGKSEAVANQKSRAPALVRMVVAVRRKIFFFAALFSATASFSVSAGVPPFQLSLVPNPAFAGQDLTVRVARPDCYGFFSAQQHPHYMEVNGPDIRYSLPMLIGVSPIGCTGALAVYEVRIGSLLAGNYSITIDAYSPKALDWGGFIELGSLQFEVLPNLAAPRPQMIPSNHWLSLAGLGALVVLLGGLVLASRPGRH
jgi:hypothetical protein